MTTNMKTTKKIDERMAIVIEIGQRITRVGIAGEFVPRSMFLSEYVDQYDDHQPGDVKPVYDANRSLEDQHRSFIIFLKNIVFRHIVASMTNRRVVIVESPLTPCKRRNALARALFECPSLSPHSILFAPSYLMCTIPFYAKNCLVVDLGSDETRIFPVCQGFLMLNQCETSPLSCSAIERRVREMFKRHGKVLTSAGSRAFIDDDLKLFDANKMAVDIVVRFCFATLVDRGLKIQSYFVDKNATMETPPADIHLPFGENQLVISGFLRESSAEVLFTDGVQGHSPSIPQAILDCVSRAPIDVRLELLRNVLVVGGLARMPGMLARLKSELIRLLSSGYTAPRLCTSFDDIRFHQFPKEVAGQLFCSWLGGSMFGVLDNAVDTRSVLRETWLSLSVDQRSVPDWTDQI